MCVCVHAVGCVRVKGHVQIRMHVYVTFHEDLVSLRMYTWDSASIYVNVNCGCVCDEYMYV